MVRAGMDIKSDSVSIHGRDRDIGHRTIFDLPVAPRDSVHHPLPALSSHPKQSERTKSLQEGFLSRASLVSPGACSQNALQAQASQATKETSQNNF